jgi:hypothetical protein
LRPAIVVEVWAMHKRRRFCSCSSPATMVDPTIVVAEARETVSGVAVECEFQELVCLAARAFPPVEVAEGREDGCCMFCAGAGVGVQEQFLCQFDAGPLGDVFDLGEPEVLRGFVHS